jgi:nucleoside 2-deoxyribosyltransferase
VRQDDTTRLNQFFDLLQSICHSAAELLHSTAASVYLKEGKRLVMHAAYGYSQSLIHKANYEVGEGITGWVAEGNEFIANSKKEILAHPKHIGKYDDKIWVDGSVDCNSMIATPLRIEGDVLGLIKVENKRWDGECQPFTDADLKTLQLFVNTLCLALRQNRELWLTLGKYFVFVLMPFRAEFKNIYDCIKQASEKTDILCTRVDDEPIVGKITEKIYESIENADIVVAVMTGRNPNVFYETGYSHAKGKPTILLADNADAIPFDLKDYSHIIYDPNDLPAMRNRLVAHYEHVKKKRLQSLAQQIAPADATEPRR